VSVDVKFVHKYADEGLGWALKFLYKGVLTMSSLILSCTDILWAFDSLVNFDTLNGMALNVS
jgi:hypothetical protein